MLGQSVHWRQGAPYNSTINCASGPVVGPRNITFAPGTNGGVFSMAEQFTVYDILLSADANGAEEPESNTATWNASQLTGTPSLAAIVGTWTLSDGDQMVITQDGTFTLNDDTGQSLYNSETGCQVTGQVSISDTAVPIYTLTAVETNGCQGILNEPNDPGAGVFIVQQGRLVGGITFAGSGNNSALLPF